MAASQFADLFARSRARSPSRRPEALEPGGDVQQGAYIQLPPGVGWRVNPLNHHTLKNQLIRHQYRQARVSAQPVSAKRVERRKSQGSDAALRKRFAALAKQWEADTEFSSSISDIAVHSSYQRIIGLGPAAVPLILRDLEKQLNHWFWALHAITGENPVPEGERGDMEAMRRRWLDWGKERGLIG